MSPDLTVEILRADDLGPDVREAWDRLRAGDPAYRSPFFHPAFAEAAGAVAPGAALAVFHRAGRIVGLFPHQRRGRQVQPLAAPLNDYHGVMWDAEEAVVPERLPALLGARSLAVNGWVGGAAEGLEARTVLSAELPHGFAAYDAERRDAFGKFFKDKDRSRRSLARDMDGEVSAEIGVRDPELLAQLIALKQDQYVRTRRHDVFACGWTVEVLSALMAVRREDFGAWLGVLRVGDRIAALELSLWSEATYHFWFPAYTPEARRCSPGILLSQDTLRLGAEQGFSSFDFGFAGEPYKKYFCNREDRVLAGTVQAPGWQAGPRRALDRLAERASGRLARSVRDRWAVIAACETSATGRLRGAAQALQAALNRSAAPASLS